MTPALHPQVAASLEDFDSETEGELQQVVEAFTHACETVGKVLDAREAVGNDLTLTPADRVLRVADVADEVMERATRAFDKAAANMRSGIENIEKQLTAPVESRAAQTIAVEVRAYIRTVNSPMDFVMNAINSGDHTSALAVLGAPAYLSGLKPDAQAALLRIYHAKHNPGLVKRQRAMQAAADLLDCNGALIFKSIEKAAAAGACLLSGLDVAAPRGMAPEVFC